MARRKTARERLGKTTQVPDSPKGSPGSMRQHGRTEPPGDE